MTYANAGANAGQWLHDTFETAWLPLRDFWALRAAELSTWSAALPISKELQFFLVLEILLLIVLVVVLRRHWRRAPAAASPTSTSVPGQLVAASARTALEPPSSFGGYLAAGIVVVTLLCGGLGGWAATSQLAGAVIASGTVVVESNVKKVQHPTGGIVGEIRVRNGDKVSQGELLVSLDATMARANLQIIAKQLDELVMRQQRLKAERDGEADLIVPVALNTRRRDADVAAIISGEISLFRNRYTSRQGLKAQLEERIAQLSNEALGLQAQLKAKSDESELIRVELDGQAELWERNLIPLATYTHTRREAARLAGEQAQLQASIAQVRGRMAETSLQILQIEQDLRTEVTKELRDAQARQAELEERRVAAEDQLRRVDIRAPQAGRVHEMAVHTVGGVVGPSEPLMLIVPEDDKLVIEARIAPQDIDHVRVGQTAVVRFTAFNQQTTPEFIAEVQHVSADLAREPQQNLAHYVTRLALAPGEAKRLGALKLVPGMPAEIYIATGDRTALSYLVKPLSDQFQRAFRER